MKMEKAEKFILTYEENSYEETAEHLYYPLYVNAYEEAIRNIYEDFLRRDLELDNCGESFEYACKDNLSRILAFIGGRGTGKSTSMIEFCKILESMNIPAKRNWWLKRSITDENLCNRAMEQSVFFKVIDVVEASNLEEKEDLFELIMAAIFKEYQKELNSNDFEVYGRRNTDIAQKFSRIMESYYALKDARKEEFGDSYISRLKSMHSSMDVRRNIELLIKDLFEQKYNCIGKKYFLVLAVDDLDLNITNGYDMLEQLHKYFFLPNVLILLSADYDQIKYVCTHHYVRSFSKGKSRVIEEDVIDQCRNLAQDYMTKILPIDLRVYMPDFVNVSRKILVNGQLDLKHYVMKKIAEKMQIHYDINGFKRHFIETKNVREFISYSRFVDSLYDIDFPIWESQENKELCTRYLNCYIKNYEQMSLDIQHRIVGNFLDEKKKVMFNQLLNKSVERKASSVCAYMKQELDDKYDASEVELYRYGDLIESIYKYGRKNEQNKSWVKCFLASLTLDMVKEKVCYANTSDETMKKEQIHKLKSFLGKTVGNEWLAEMVPRLRGDNEVWDDDGWWDNPTKIWGYVEINSARFSLTVNLNNNIVTRLAKKNTREKAIKEISTIFEKKKIFETLECIAMFLYPRDNSWDWIDYLVTAYPNIEDKNNNKLAEVDGNNLQNVGVALDNAKKGEMITDGNPTSVAMSFELKNQPVVFDILGFVMKSIEWNKKHDIFCERLVNTIVEKLVFACRNMDLQIQDRDGLEEELKATFLYMIIPQVEWKEASGAFPFYELDLAYNVIKRARKELIEENSQNITSGQCLDAVKKVYEKIIGVLKREEGEYEKLGIELDYSSKMKSFPFVNMICTADSELKRVMGKKIEQLLYFEDIIDAPDEMD